MGFIFFIFLLFCAVSCQSDQTCGNKINSFYIQYPFQLLQENQNPQTNYSHSKFILKCNAEGLTVLNIPSSGDFYVRNINYFDQKIQLYDPGNCLPGRLMNINLSTISPFAAVIHQNYTFFSCPSKALISSNLSIISCLSNSINSIIATSLVSTIDEIMRLRECNVILSNKIPVSFVDQYEISGFDGDLQLAWNVRGKSRSIPIPVIIIICCITISIAILATLFCIGCCLRFTGQILDSDDTNIQRPQTTTRVWALTTISSPPRTNLSTQDDPWMNRSTEDNDPWMNRSTEDDHDPWMNHSTEDDDRWMNLTTDDEPSVAETTNREAIFFSTELLVIGGKECISGPNNDTCSICLQDYTASERLRRICKCDHCFHARCLETWLETKGTCPICRTVVI